MGLAMHASSWSSSHAKSAVLAMFESTQRELADRSYLNSGIVVWALTYWAAAIVQPDLVGNVSQTVSVMSMVVMGGLILGNLVLDSRVLWVLLGAFMAFGIVSSWVLSTQWTVPYSAVPAGISMAVLNAVTAIAAFAKVLET